jgi:hypothetical protein
MEELERLNFSSTDDNTSCAYFSPANRSDGDSDDSPSLTPVQNETSSLLALRQTWDASHDALYQNRPATGRLPAQAPRETVVII